MIKEKKIEDLLASIHNLIMEAQNANLSISDAKDASQIQSQGVINTKIIQNDGKENSSKNNDGWENIKFKNYQSYLESTNTENKDFQNKLKEIFEKKIEEWSKENLKEILEKEISLKSKALIAEKLK